MIECRILIFILIPVTSARRGICKPMRWSVPKTLTKNEMMTNKDLASLSPPGLGQRRSHGRTSPLCHVESEAKQIISAPPGVGVE